MMKSVFRKIKNNVPLYAFVSFALALISLILFIFIRNFVSFADFFNDYLSRPMRILVSSVTSIVPFSIAEMFLLLIPIWIVVVVLICIWLYKKGGNAIRHVGYFAISVLCCIFVMYVWTYTSGYYNTTIDKKLGYDSNKITENDIYETAIFLTRDINSLSNEIVYDFDGASMMPYTYDDLSNEVYKAYDSIVKNYGIAHNFRSRVKPILLSEPMTYTHISGIYSFMTGESNINTNYPDFIVASTVGHEMAHQRGIAREDEANFLGFLVGYESNDAFLKYSAYLDVYADVMNALYTADKDKYFEVYAMLNEKAKQDKYCYGVMFAKYAESKAAEVSNKINDTYLKSNGQKAGTKTYGMVAKLTVGFYVNYIKKS